MATADVMLDVDPRELRLDARELDVVRSFAPVLEPRLGEMVDAYYAHLASTRYGSLMTADRIEIAKPIRIAHWRLLLTANFEALQRNYETNYRPRVLDGIFPPSVFLHAANWFAAEFGRVVDRSADIPKALKSELRTTLTRLAFYDLALASKLCEVAWID